MNPFDHSRIIAQALREVHADIAKHMPDNPALAGWGSYAQCDEDGIIRDCLRRIEQTAPLSKTFVEIGCADGLQNNTHQLLLDGYRGVWVDGAPEKVEAIANALGGHTFAKLLVLQAMIDLRTIDAVVTRSAGFLNQALDFLSLDIDGNDLHVMPACLKALQPKLICVEYNAKFPPPTRLTVAYDEQMRWAGDDYFGATLQSWVDQLHAAGYTLVCCNASGVNAFFVRNDLLKGFTSYSVDQLYQPVRYYLIETQHGHPPSYRWLKQAIA
jgi:hypothetical protein